MEDKSYYIAKAKAAGLVGFNDIRRVRFLIGDEAVLLVDDRNWAAVVYWPALDDFEEVDWDEAVKKYADRLR